jgi:hypothetical protein
MTSRNELEAVIARYNAAMLGIMSPAYMTFDADGRMAGVVFPSLHGLMNPVSANEWMRSMLGKMARA